MLAILVAIALCHRGELSFHVTSPGLKHFTGRVVVYFGDQGSEPRFGPNWSAPKPLFSTIVKDEDGDLGFTITSENSVSFPRPLRELAPGTYTFQAVIDRNLGGRAIGSSPRNLYSVPITTALNPHNSGPIEIQCTKTVEEPHLLTSPSEKEFRVHSKSLSDWYGRPTQIKAAVILPKEYDANSQKRYPVIYIVPGFGGTFTNSAQGGFQYTNLDGVPFIAVVLDPNCPTGHCVFADSANNGPWGTALTREFIPSVDQQFRTYTSAGARFVTGHSSGGWSSLWLQVAYPNVFGGVWSTSPDPVDFRDFQKIDLYQKGNNMFTDERGDPRPLARIGNKPFIFYRVFSDMERPLRGEQLGSFEGVFSPKGSDGEPEQLWNRDTGAINFDVAQTWKRFDIDYLLRTQWSQRKAGLVGKIHVFTGDLDTFYLEGAVKNLKRDLKAVGSDADIEIWPGNHFTVLSPTLLGKIEKQMAERFRAFQASNPGQANAKSASLRLHFAR